MLYAITKYLILMAARQNDKGNGRKLKLKIADFRLQMGLWMWDVRLGSGGLRISDCGSVIGHLASPSLGHYASLSFVVIGRGKRPGERKKGFFCGSGFPALSLSKGSRDLVL